MIPSWIQRNAVLLVCLGLIAAGAASFLSGLEWGLPSRRIDPYLFGQHPVWSGQQIIQLGGMPATNAERAVDVSSQPLDRTKPVIVNPTDEQRARYLDHP